MTTSILNSSEHVQSCNIFSSYAPTMQLFSQIPRFARSQFVYRAEIIPTGFLLDLPGAGCLIRETRFGSPRGSLVGCITCADLEGEAVGAPGPRLHRGNYSIGTKWLREVPPDYSFERNHLSSSPSLPKNLGEASFPSFPGFARDPISFKLPGIFHYTYACTHTHTHTNSRRMFLSNLNATWWDFNLRNAFYVINSSFFF